MDNDQIDKLLHSYISGTITPQESRQLEAWGDESEENRQILDLIEGHSDLGGELSRMYRYDKEKVWRRVCEEDRRYMRRSRLLRSLRIGAAAAVLAGMLVSGALLYQAGERLDSNRNRLLTTVEPGVRRAVLELSSGEQVLLADSVRTELSERNVRIEINGDEIAYTASEKSGKQAEEAYNTIRVPLGGEYSLTLGDARLAQRRVEHHLSPAFRFLALRHGHRRGLLRSGSRQPASLRRVGLGSRIDRPGNFVQCHGLRR